jgi:hypothetical protein
MTDNTSTIITGAFTLGGTLLGWFLNSFSKKGTLKIIDKHFSILQVDDGFHHPTNDLQFKYRLLVYNSSDDIKPIAGIQLLIEVHGNEFEIDCYNSNMRVVNHHNFNPKHMTELVLQANYEFGKHILAGDVNSASLVFQDYKKRKKSFIIYENPMLFVEKLIKSWRFLLALLLIVKSKTKQTKNRA